jgi:hypothetical protein
MSVEMGARRSSQSASTPTGSLVSARFATDPSRKDQVEIALAVVDEWQFQGVGSSLIDHLIEFASRRLHPVGGLAWSRRHRRVRPSDPLAGPMGSEIHRVAACVDVMPHPAVVSRAVVEGGATERLPASLQSSPRVDALGFHDLDQGHRGDRAPVHVSRLDPHLAVVAHPQRDRCMRQRPRAPIASAALSAVVLGHDQAQSITERAQPIDIALAERQLDRDPPVDYFPTRSGFVPPSQRGFRAIEEIWLARPGLGCVEQVLNKG